MNTAQNLCSMKDASRWASAYLNRAVTPSNISYLLQYGVITRHGGNGGPLINLEELKQYYNAHDKRHQWKQKLGDDLNWNLSFAEYQEWERTKHVHRLHPYKGKFIPQLVAYFLDDHVDEFKRQVCFKPGDIVLDPFCGSGTTLVQANELGMHAVGVDISAFNAMISNAKVARYDIPKLAKTAAELTARLDDFQRARNIIHFEEELLSALARFNAKHFPSPEYKRQVRQGEINEPEYAGKRAEKFSAIYAGLVTKHGIQIEQAGGDSFLDKWFLHPVREEIDFLFAQLKTVDDSDLKKILAIMLSRTARTCRATTHADLGTLKEPVTAAYYCKKHGKICKPLFSIGNWWKRYAADTVKRLREFDALRTDTHQLCLAGDGAAVDIGRALGERDAKLAGLLAAQKARGIFSSPPYVGLIDYHEQHAYSYEIFGFSRNDEREIGPLSRGQGKDARNDYANGIAAVLRNCKRCLQPDYDVFLVANDKFNLYPGIADNAGMRIVERYKRPVLNRVEKDRGGAYAEIIFHMKDKQHARIKNAGLTLRPELDRRFAEFN